MDQPLVLVVDDDTLQLRATARTLDKAGYRVVQAETGHEAIQVAQQKQPDLILLDRVLPDTDGLQVCQQIKADLAPAQTMMILMSALKTTSHEQADGLEMGADGYIARPISGRELVARVQTFLRLKRANDELHRREHQLRLLTDHAPAYIALVGADDLCYRFVNARYEAGFGLSRDEIIGQPVREVIGSKNYAFALPYIERARAGEHVSYENTFDLEQGKRWIRISYVPDVDAEGRVVAIVVLGYDITGRVQAQQELQASEERYRSLVESSEDMVFSVDREGVFRAAGGARLREFGLAPRDVVGRTLYDLFGDDAAIYEAQHRQVFATGESITYEHTFEFNGLAKVDLTTVYPIQGTNGTIQEVGVICRDITARAHAAAALQNYSQRLEDMVEERTEALKDAQERLLRQGKLAALGEMAGSVGHELRNPLGVISNTVYYLNAALGDRDAQIQESLDMLSDAVLKSERIVSDLLDFARTRHPDRTYISLSDLVHQTMEEQPPPAHIEVVTTLPADLPEVFVDPHQIGLVLANLIVNAYEAMPQEGQLSLDAGTDDTKVWLSISDTGSGITPDQITKIFEPLFTTKRGGIGLGLTISDNLARANGGEIQVESAGMPGQGSTFTITLPCEERGA